MMPSGEQGAGQALAQATAMQQQQALQQQAMQQQAMQQAIQRQAGQRQQRTTTRVCIVSVSRALHPQTTHRACRILLKAGHRANPSPTPLPLPRRRAKWPCAPPKLHLPSTAASARQTAQPSSTKCAPTCHHARLPTAIPTAQIHCARIIALHQHAGAGARD